MSGEIVISWVLSAADTVTRDIGVEKVLEAIRTGGKKTQRANHTNPESV